MVIVEGKTLIDAHAHLDSYSDEIDSVLEEIFKHRILTISNSMDIPSYERNLEIGNACDFVIPTFGVHPWNAHIYADQLNNPGGIKWLTGKPGMPLLINDVVRELAKVKNTTPKTIIKTVDSNFVQLIERELGYP